VEQRQAELTQDPPARIHPGRGQERLCHSREVETQSSKTPSRERPRSGRRKREVHGQELHRLSSQAAWVNSLC
jgi:hypothetical protein